MLWYIDKPQAIYKNVDELMKEWGEDYAYQQMEEPNREQSFIDYITKNYYDNTMLFYDTEEQKMYGAQDLLMKVLKEKGMLR